MTFRTHLSELDVRQGRSQFPDDRMKLYITIFSDFEAPPPHFLILTRLFHNLTALKPPWVKEHTNICRGFFRTDRRQYSCYQIWV